MRSKSKVSHTVKVERMQQQILEHLSQLIREEVKDPGVSRMTSIVRVEVANDLKYARVYVTTYGTDEERKAAMDGLNRAKGFLKTRLWKIMQTKVSPELSFINDTSIEYAAYIQQKLNSLNIRHDDEETTDESSENEVEE